MKKLLFFFALLLTCIAMAQAPQGLNYQAVVRNSSGSIMANQMVTFKMSVIKNTTSSDAVYAETHAVQTDDLGQVNFVIGQGTPLLSTFNVIDWANGNSYLKIELNTGSGYTDMGTTQFMSVPYALFAGNSGNQFPNGTVPGQMLYWNGSQWTTVAPGETGQSLFFCNGIPHWGPCESFSTLAVPGNHNGWEPSTAPLIKTDGTLSHMEGYMWLDGAYKFVAPDTNGAFQWGNIDYGDNGTFTGMLAVTGETECYAAAGYYRVQANTNLLTYAATATAWGIIGAATPGGWDFSTPLAYNPSSLKWEGTMNMIVGDFKFRANNAWDINLGVHPNSPSYLGYDGGNLTITTAGTYFVTLDLSNGNHYQYTATLQ